MNPGETYLDSEILASLRLFTELYPSLMSLTGPIARYKIVLDANIAARDLVHKFEKPHIRQTAIEEAVKSTTIELHAPIWLDEEMTNSTIPKMARRRGISETELRSLWADYKSIIIWDHSHPFLDGGGICDGDPKDAPYVALQRSISAAAILSDDKDIDQLGGKRVSLEFVLVVRSYARTASFAVGIRVGGSVVTTVSVRVLAQMTKLLTSSISRLPPAAKVALIASVAFVAIHPASRRRILELLKGLGDHLVDAWPTIETLILTAAEKQSEAQKALSNAQRLLDEW